LDGHLYLLDCISTGIRTIDLPVSFTSFEASCFAGSFSDLGKEVLAVFKVAIKKFVKN